MGRTPMIGKTVREFLPEDELLAYCTAILRVYNRFGRRDNKYKARIKILVHELGLDEFKREVEAEYAARRATPRHRACAEELDASRPTSRRRRTRRCPTATRCTTSARGGVRPLGAQQRHAHKVPGYAIVNVSLKPIGGIPGDATSEQMRRSPTSPSEFSHGEIRVTHEQNLVLPHVPQRRPVRGLARARGAGLATANRD